MSELFRLLGRQLRIAVWIGLVAGALLGAALGGLLAMLENAPLLLSGSGARLCAPLLLAAICAWGSIAALLPLALLLAVAQAIWPGLRAVRARWLYAGAWLAGSFFVFAALWVAFNLVRDVTAVRSVAIFAGLAVIAATVFLLLLWLGRGPGDGAEAAPNSTRLAAGLVLSIVVGPVAYASLAAHLGARPAASDGAGPAPANVQTIDRGLVAPDVILVSIDTLRADHLSANGYARQTSPHLDALAAAGVNFVEARSQAPWTLPSHATMMVSRYPSSSGVRYVHNFLLFHAAVSDILTSENLTLAEILRAAGFRTAAFTSCEYLTPRFGFDQGFQQMEKVNPNMVDHAATVIDKGIAWLAADSASPAFLFLHLYTVHQYASPTAYDTLYQNPDYHGLLKDRPLMTSANLYDSLTGPDLQYLEAKYDGALHYVDDQLGRLFTWLQDQGRYDHTLVVITSDHGEEFWEHGGTGHGFTLYEEQLRVPLIIKPPSGFAVGARQPRVPAGVIDIAPTILDYAGLSRQPMMEGITLRPAIETGAGLDRSLFAEATFFFNTYALIRPDYKYIDNHIPPLDPLNVGLLLANIRSLYHFRDDELYQIEQDPGERVNLLRSQPGMTAQLHDALLEHIRAGQTSASVVLDAATSERLRALGYRR